MYFPKHYTTMGTRRVRSQDVSYRSGSDKLFAYFHRESSLSHKHPKEYEKFIIEEVKNMIDIISIWSDRRFSDTMLTVGSFWNGLKVINPQEFDVNVVIGDANCELSPGSAVDQVKLKIPTDGSAAWASQKEKSWLSVIFCQRNDDAEWINLSAKRVFQTLKADFQELRQLIPSVCTIETHGTAVNLGLSKDDMAAHVDVSAVVRGPRRRIPSWTGWPHPKARWPDAMTIQAVHQAGINWVALPSSDEWKISFSEAENALLKSVDTKAKMVLCLVKTFALKCHWSHGTSKSEFSSYVMKNVWLWYMEDLPNPMDWAKKKLEKRVLGLLDRLLKALDTREAPQYFFPEVNLLAKYTEEDIMQFENNIKKFRRNIWMHI